MTILKIYTAPDPILHISCAPVDNVNDDIRKLMDDMLETMYDAPGIGLAANQVGIHKSVVVMDLTADDEPKDPLYFVNPVITILDDAPFIYKEGCLSVPEIYDFVKRPRKISVDFLDYNGNPDTMIAEDLLSTCIQHEVDHLNGVLFLDRLPRIKRSGALKKINKKFKLK